MGFPVLMSSEDVDRKIDELRVSSCRSKVRPMSPPEQLVHSLAALHARFPHICNRVELLWGTPELSSWLRNLVMDAVHEDGKPRQGFPPEVMEHILKVCNIHSASCGETVPKLWDFRAC